MSSQHQSNEARASLIKRFCSNPKVQKVVTTTSQTFGNVLDKYNYGLKVSKTNARDTLNEMGKFFSAAEAKSAFTYSKELAAEVHEELVGCKVRLLSETVRTVFESQVRSMWNRDNFSIDNSGDDDSEDQD